jgi:glycosyltransferase involved in cell wall biosynthesis
MTIEHEKKVLVVVPVFNASRWLPQLIERCRKVVDESRLLFVNDGSTDDSLAILKEQDVNYLSFVENQGKGAALKAGFNYAVAHGFDAVLTLDADLQHLPEEIPRFLAANDGKRLLIGTRRIETGTMPVERWFINNLTSLVISVFSGRRVRDSQSGYRLIPVWLLRAIRLESVRYDSESEILFKAGALGCTVAEIPVSTIYEGSHSYIHPFKDSLRFVRQVWHCIWS